MSVGPDDHRCFLDLFRIISLDNINSIEAPQGGKTLLPGPSRAVLSNKGFVQTVTPYRFLGPEPGAGAMKSRPRKLES